MAALGLAAVLLWCAAGLLSVLSGDTQHLQLMPQLPYRSPLRYEPDATQDRTLKWAFECDAWCLPFLETPKVSMSARGQTRKMSLRAFSSDFASEADILISALVQSGTSFVRAELLRALY